MSTTAKCLLLVLVGSLLLGGCAGMNCPNMPVTGFLYSDLKATSVVTANADGNKVGYGEAKSILGLVSLGDASVGSAMKKVGITKVQRVDYEFKNILGIYATVKIEVHGQ